MQQRKNFCGLRTRRTCHPPHLTGLFSASDIPCEIIGPLIGKRPIR